MTDNVLHRGELVRGPALEAEYKRRDADSVRQSIGLKQPIPDGWELEKQLKTRQRIVYKKPLSSIAEDAVWCLFFEMGFASISSRDFALVLRDTGQVRKTKQLDVVAQDDDIVFAVECKSRETVGTKSLKKDVAEFAGNLDDIRAALKGLLSNRNLKIVPILATHNILMDQNDRLDAEAAHIKVWDEYDVMALRDLAALAGEGARYQVYNRVFRDHKIKDFAVTVPAIKDCMGGHDYYSFTLEPEILLRVAYVHRRGRESGFLDVAESYQRMITKSRLQQVARYIEDGGLFPGSIIVNFTRPLREDALCTKEQMAKLDAGGRPVMLTLPPYYGSAWVIDGQHRLYGFADLPQKHSESLQVTAFVEESPAFQAQTFVDINQNQKAVEAALLWDLYEDLYSDSTEEREQHLYAIGMTAKLLHSATWSPLRGLIEIPKEQNSAPVGLRTICYAMNQQKLLAKKEGLLYKDNYSDTIEYAAKRIAAFFEVFATEMRDEWNLGPKHYICSNAGVHVLLGILRDIVDCNLARDELDDLTKFSAAIRRFCEPLILHLMEARSAELDGYRSAGAAGQKSRETRAALTRTMTAEGGFRSRWLERFDAQQSKLQRERSRVSLDKYLERAESDELEFKASLTLDIDRYLYGDGTITRNTQLALDGALRTIVAFLNSNGGDLVIGVGERRLIERQDLRSDRADEFEIVSGKLVVGIDLEYDKKEWDGYLLKLTDLIADHIDPNVIDDESVRIRVASTPSNRHLCIITVRPADSRMYLDNRFQVRRNNATHLLEGKEIDKYWVSRTGRGDAAAK